MRQDVTDFVKGCTICQSTKPRMTQPKPPLYPITNESDALPFETIALDFITKLPESEGNDTILTITDQACSKVSQLYRAVGSGFGIFGVYSKGVKVIRCLLSHKH